MPLYKRKLVVQRSGNVNLNSNTESKKKRAFQTPLIQNEIRLNHFKNEKESIVEKQDQQTENYLTNRYSKISASAEFHLNFEDEIGNPNIFSCENTQPDKTIQNSNIKRSKITTKRNRNKNIGRNDQKAKVISNIFGNVKEKSFDSIENNVHKNEKIIHSKHANNNEKNSKRIKNKVFKRSLDVTKNSRDEANNAYNSDLEESIVSLWRQSDVPPSLEPPAHLSHKERLLWLQDKRNVGLYVQCDKCDKFRYLKDTVDPLELPDVWYCYMNPDKNYNKCTDPEYEIPVWEEEDLIHNLYNAGSIVWAKLDGFPWWPAIVDDDPDTEMYYWLNEYSDIPTFYHVAFFDSGEVSRAWIKPKALLPFKLNMDNPIVELSGYEKKYKFRISAAKEQANNALKLNLADRLKKYSFLGRWNKPINTPKDLVGKEQKKRRKRIVENKFSKKERQSKNYLKENKFSTDKCNNNYHKSPISERANYKITAAAKQYGDTHATENEIISPDIFDGNDELFDIL